MTPDKKRLRIGVLFGGRSGEHEVSLASAASVIRGLDPDKYEILPIGITKEGHWLIGSGAQKMLPEVLRTGQRVTMSADPTDAALVRLEGWIQANHAIMSKAEVVNEHAFIIEMAMSAIEGKSRGGPARELRDLAAYKTAYRMPIRVGFWMISNG